MKNLKKILLSGLAKSVFFYLLVFAANISAQTTSFIHLGVEQGLTQSQVQTLLQDGEGNLWVGTMGGVSKFNGKSFVTYKKKDGLAEDWVVSACKTKSGNIWFGHWGGGVSVYDLKSNKFKNLEMEEKTAFKSVKAIVEDANGIIWIGTQGKGILRINPSDFQAISYSKSNGLLSENISCLIFDNKQNLWIGSDKGITIVPKGVEITKASVLTLNELNGLNVSKIKTFAQGSENEIWVGTEDIGVLIVSTDELLTNGNPSLKGQINEELLSPKITFIDTDKDSNKWVGTKGGGVTKISKDGKIKHFTTRQGLNYYNANCIVQDRENNIWIGTDLGLNQYRGERFQTFDIADGIANNLIWSVIEDSKGSLWLGTNHGISVINYTANTTGNSDRISNDFSIKNYFSDEFLNNAVLSLFEDKKGIIWIGTANAGVYRIDTLTGKPQAFSSMELPSSSTVFAICDDNEGNIWFGTKEGAVKYNPTTSEFLVFNSENGLSVNSIYRIFKDSKGNLWFGALGGYLTMYDGNKFQVFNEKSGINHKFILCMNEDKAGNIWFGAYGGGLYKFDGNVFKNFTIKEGLKSESPYSLISDNSGNIWIGTSNGIEKYDVVNSLFTHYGKADGFSGVETNANAICRDSQGNIWFGTIMGVVKFNPSEDKTNMIEPLTRINGIKIFQKEAHFPVDSKFNYDQNHITFCFSGISLTSPEKVNYQYKLEGFDEEWSPITKSGEAVYSNLPHGNYTFMVKASNNDNIWNIEAETYRFSIVPPFWSTLWFKGIVLFCSIGLLYGFVKLRIRSLSKAKKELEQKVSERTVELADKNKELARKNKEVTDSINYAKRIQDAILPDLKKINKALPDSFILFQPKDIVSGDFYFFTERNDKIIISSVDCTGHGVPGAFMSMIGSSFLNQIVNEMGITDPSAILLELHKKVLKALNKDLLNRESIDGMDMSIISFDINTLELTFAGALRPLYCFFGNEFLEIKGDRFSIGGVADMENTNYNNHYFKGVKGDSLYLFSDGFADQFGGDSGKKFMSQRFKSFLYEIKDLPMVNQKQRLEETFNNWRGKLEQVDDILVIGVRI
ncbi:MAG: SpoIIE family protein phosphatase [Bacteroidetes bacterium]|nr:SpoIIE family protein phosphatase [Bacteroidota bacterium]HET6244407.1 two-component regulator propeller domain-containing protein [Bacteroidia bacterium]